MAKRVLVLDFDNCLVLDPHTRVGSEELKKSAWFTVFPYEPAVLSQVIDEANQKNAGGRGDRRDVVRLVLEHFAGKASDNEITRYCDLFNKEVQARILQIGVSRDTRDTLAQLYELEIPLYINTGTPTVPIEQSLKTLGIFYFFKGVFGRPGNKEENLLRIIANEGVEPDQVIFVDDSAKAWEIAQRVGCRFVGMQTKANTAWHHGTLFPLIYRLSELLEMI